MNLNFCVFKMLISELLWQSKSEGRRWQGAPVCRLPPPRFSSAKQERTPSRSFQCISAWSQFWDTHCGHRPARHFCGNRCRPPVSLLLPLCSNCHLLWFHLVAKTEHVVSWLPKRQTVTSASTVQLKSCGKSLREVCTMKYTRVTHTSQGRWLMVSAENR